MRLEGGTHFLVLRRSPDFINHSVHMLCRYDDVLANWKAGDRVSPISPLENASIPNLSDADQRWVHFVGPIYPGKMIGCPGKLYLSLGIFNVVVLTENIKDYDAVFRFLSQQKVNWEEWSLIGNRIEKIQYSTLNLISGEGIPSTVLAPMKLKYDELKGPVFEYRALVASTIGRAAVFIPHVVQDLRRFDTIFRDILIHKKMTYDSVSKHGLLTIANAALSRHSSQTFAGSSPIIETENHDWSHSLLGLGIASLALRRIRDFIEKGFSSSGILERLKCLKNADAPTQPLYQISSNNSFWEKDFLYEYESQKKLIVGDQQLNDDLPLITCFSGRDGFRSTQISLSAPFAVITGCNTTSWTLLTLTHELSHTVIDGVLGLLLPNPDKEEELRDAANLLKGSHKENMFNCLREMLCYAFWVVGNHGKVDASINSNDLATIIRKNGIEINEILTHVFDFLYFYRKDQDHYIRSIWSSWGVIPNIRHRIPDYINRTLCALHANNLRRKDSYRITLDQLNECLCKTLELYPESPYIEDAIRQLKENREQYRKELIDRELLVKFVRHFLYSPSIESMITREPNVTGGERGGYPHKVLEFSENIVRNPFRFIEEFSRDEKPDRQRSLWMLQQLAFGDEL